MGVSKMHSRLMVVVCAGFIGTAPASGDEAPSENVQQAREIVQSFAGDLKSELVAAMKEGGPVQAVSVCHTEAPRIARESGEATGWDVARTSFKVRNPDNAPDEWERRVLESFAQRMAEGEPPKSIEHVEKVERNGETVLRYMKAIPTAEVCVTCHGTDLDPELTAKLDELYPEDQARGFNVGDLRGAFTLTKTLAE